MAKRAESERKKLVTPKRLGIASLVLIWIILTAIQWRMLGSGIGGSTAETVTAFSLINLNIVILLILIFLTLRNIAKLIVERKKGVLGAHLKTKLVLAFLSTTVIPTTLLFVASASFLSLSVDRWFSEKVDQALKNAMEVARTYYGSEEKQVLWAGRALGNLLEESSPVFSDKGASDLLLGEMKSLGVDHAAILFPKGGQIDVSIDKAVPVPAVDRLGTEARAVFSEGRSNALIVQSGDGNYLRAFTPVHKEGRVEMALVVDRFMPMWTLRRLEEIRKGFEEYKQTEILKKPIKSSYIFPLLFVSLLITFAAIWFGFYLARTITEPIGALADATHRVAAGDLDFELKAATGDEMGKLVKAFNLMTGDLRQSRAHVEAAQETLRNANIELESRRMHMEAVLGRITAGVIGTDARGFITTINPAAIKLLRLEGEVQGRFYKDAFSPEFVKSMESIVAQKRKDRVDTVEEQIEIAGEHFSHTVMVHITTLRGEGGEILGYVAVLNDLTDVVRAQRARAWREVARRVAHEIKNPLTPIQLSAQRLRRRYSELLETPDGEVLDESTRTIIAQVDGLKYMVNEFSRFAKLPESRPVPSHFNPVVEEVLGLYRTPHQDISFEVSLSPSLPIVEIDVEQIKRVIVNLMDNAVSAVESYADKRIEILTEHDPERHVVRLVIADSGHGLTAAAREKLFEPYFSTKKSGTGLGLAIVKSIMEDHRGYVRAADRKPRGTRFILEFPLPGADA